MNIIEIISIITSYLTKFSFLYFLYDLDVCRYALLLSNVISLC